MSKRRFVVYVAAVVIAVALAGIVTGLFIGWSTKPPAELKIWEPMEHRYEQRLEKLP